jgi:hypothetical protein
MEGLPALQRKLCVSELLIETQLNNNLLNRVFLVDGLKVACCHSLHPSRSVSCDHATKLTRYNHPSDASGS